MKLEAKKDAHWGDTGRNKFLTRHVELPDPNFVSEWDFDTAYADRILKTPKMGVASAYIRQSATSTGTTTLNNGERAIFTFTTNTPAQGGLRNICVPDISIYAGAFDPQYLLPGGSSIDDSEWQVIGPWNDWGQSDGIYTVTRIFVRNISAGATDIVVKGQARAIASGRKTT